MKFESTFPSLTTTQVDSWETALGIKLPDSYRNFLLCHNGGRSDLCVCDIPGWGTSLVNDFFGIHAGDECDIAINLESYEGRIPHGFLPIGDDPAGNLFLLGLSGEVKENVFFWDHENEPYDKLDDWESFGNIYKIASSFDSFMSGLKPE